MTVYIPEISLEEITLRDLLTVDTHGQRIRIVDETPEGFHQLIPSRNIFFGKRGLYANVVGKGLSIIKDKKTINLNTLINEINYSNSSCLVLIEGFAGCGKSTLVQYILYKQLETERYDYSFYDYDLEAQNDIITHDKNGVAIKRSSIIEAVKRSFFEQFCKQIAINKTVFEDFCSLLEKCEHFQPFSNLYYQFFNTNTFDDIRAYVNDGINNRIHIVKRNLFLQAGQISSSVCILAIDYLFRLAMYKNRMIDKLYICYDNIDAIEDAEDLKGFDEKLVLLKSWVDAFISDLQQDHFFLGIPKPHFIIMVTYRKITAVVAKVKETLYKEVEKDRSSDPIRTKSIYYIDATSAFSYREIVKKRQQYFDRYFNTIIEISSEKKQQLRTALYSWNQLNQNLLIMKDRYASLWNKNYRTCSFIAEKLYENSDYDFAQCVDFIKTHNIIDGYSSSSDENGDSILCSYFGGSAVILNSVCRVFNDCKIWDNLLQLAQLNRVDISYKNISFSRIILTYICNLNRPVTLSELYLSFCRDNLFSSSQLCTILSNLLARNRDGVWRRPIYYSSEYILSEDVKEIEQKLWDACLRLQDGKEVERDYDFIICASGKTYVEQLMQEFEFFSNRLSNNNNALYLYSNVKELKSIINSVYCAVSRCCKNMLEFRTRYLQIKKISGEEYLSLPIHPTTKSKKPQLHTERVIFSHIAYLNKVRLYFVDVKVTTDYKKRLEYNELFITYISNYLKLYKENILPISSERKRVWERLETIVKAIQTAKQDSFNSAVLFQSISL